MWRYYCLQTFVEFIWDQIKSLHITQKNVLFLSLFFYFILLILFMYFIIHLISILIFFGPWPQWWWLLSFIVKLRQMMMYRLTPDVTVKVIYTSCTDVLKLNLSPRHTFTSEYNPLWNIKFSLSLRSYRDDSNILDNWRMMDESARL